MATRSALDDLDVLAETSTKPLQLALERLVRAQAGTGSIEAARLNLQEILTDSLILSDLLGRRRLLLEADRAEAQQFSSEPKAIVPKVAFASAIANLLKREPRLVSVASEVREVYRSGFGFTAIRAASEQVVEKVRDTVARLARVGTTVASAATVVAELAGWTRAYSETVFRTNLNTAYTAGRFEQAKTPAVAAVFGAFEYMATRDSDVRRGRPRIDRGENHLAANSLLAATNDPVWENVKPPNGFNCRCQVRLISRFELERRGLLASDGSVIRQTPPGFSNFAAHPSFTSKPGIYP